MANPEWTAKIPGFTPLRQRLRRVRQGFQRLRTRARKGGFWKALWYRRIRRIPVWYTDRSGISIRLYPEDVNLEHVFGVKQHFDDEAVLWLTRKLLTHGAVVLDVGANCGIFTVFVAPLVGVTGQVHAFEPTQASFRRLTENVARLNGKVRTVRLNREAVGDYIGHAMFYEYAPGCSVWNSLSPHGMTGGEATIMPAATVQVPMTTLDQYCTDHGIAQIDLLKVDVEGFEIEVLRGCTRLLGEKRLRHLIFEISVEPLKGLNLTAKAVLQSVSDLGFDIEVIHPDGTREPVQIDLFSAPHFANYLGIPRQR